MILLLSTFTFCIHLIRQAPHVHCQAPGPSPQVENSLEIRNYHIDTPCWLTSKDRNFLAKIVNGNRGTRGTGLKLAHWNKGPAYLHNKHLEIETLITDHHPHLLGLSEANLKKDHDHSLVQHADYHLRLPPTLVTQRLILLGL